MQFDWLIDFIRYSQSGARILGNGKNAGKQAKAYIDCLGSGHYLWGGGLVNGENKD
jgi:hypothetical protein